tara:strand:+ start:592 stop:801 length:210 start_codon:yes stop_codon:yes gene_type:complete
MTIFNPSFVVTPEKLFAERLWRNDELARTDILVATPDHPERENLLAYRVLLRDWPLTENFPDTRPVLGE